MEKTRIELDYLALTKHLVDNGIVAKDEIFDYFGTPNEREYDEIFKFYQENLNRQSRFGVSPSTIFFNEGVTLNAKANCIDGHYLISVNKGTVYLLMKHFKFNDTLFDGDKLKKYREFEKRLDTSLNVLMYQYALHFTFYHEFGHLIQKSKYLGLGLEETNKCLDKNKSSKKVL